MAAIKVIEKDKKASLQRTVTFVARIEAATSVRVTGDFTEWSQGGIPLAMEAGGEWKTLLKLAPGEYQYRLIVDGEWRDHPEAQKRVPNPFGSENDVLIVR
jgi:hypothetical protein